MSSSPLRRSLAIGVAVLGILGAAAIWVGTDLVTRLATATSVVSQTSNVIEETIQTADAVIESIDAGLSGADSIVADIAESTDRSAAVIEDASLLLRADVADSVESVEAALPGLIGAGRVIDDTLSALAIFGVPYESEVPFAQALQDVDDSLEGLADELRAQGVRLGEVAEPVRSAGTETARLAATLADVQESLADARSQLAEYGASASELREVVAVTTADPGLLQWLGRAFAVAWLVVAAMAGALTWPGPDAD